MNEITYSLITAQIHQSKSEEIGNVIIGKIIAIFQCPEIMTMDIESAVMSYLITYLFKRLKIKIKITGAYNHQSLQVDSGTKSLSTK